MPRRPTEDEHQANLRRNTAGILAHCVTFLVAAATLTPYIWDIPERNMNLVTQAQTTLWNGWMLVLAYYFKARENNPTDAHTISTQAETIKKAQDALSPPAKADTVEVRPGEEVRVEGVDKK